MARRPCPPSPRVPLESSVRTPRPPKQGFAVCLRATPHKGLDPKKTKPRVQVAFGRTP